MRWAAPVIVLMLLAVLAAPAFANDDSARYSYISIENVSINLAEEHAVVTVDYTIDDGISLLVMLLGKSDLRRKVLEVLDFENARVQRLDLNRAVVIVSNASDDYGGGTYWFPKHTFTVQIPDLTVTTPQETRRFTHVREVPGGIGYFAAT
ncbi:hypothetical protein FGU65_01140 [Methanoculleus sp. FWC-SCC1]|uniref:Uncharacterized protein n=1 Tax=Methanoculleus frigidifontis TaxID=2584085 RepID=A0ABT8M6F6_9EURY|nr:hypothetical protein [Methanoculleus sp. FWC-SCC1]MDN7023517.1 hypothetical protein [Methanoculleus sp. FWC-SCC1]